MRYTVRKFSGASSMSHCIISFCLQLSFASHCHGAYATHGLVFPIIAMFLDQAKALFEHRTNVTDHATSLRVQI